MSDADICNLALSAFGSARIRSLDDANETANLCTLWYPQVRNEVLVETGVRWQPAKARAQLSELSTTPTFGWDHQYQLPADLLRLDYVTDEEVITLDYISYQTADAKYVSWEREGDVILSNWDTCYILYIKLLTDTAKFTPLMIEAIYTKLGAALAGKLAQNRQAQERLLLFYRQDVLPRAKAANNQEVYVPNEGGADDWSDTGRY